MDYYNYRRPHQGYKLKENGYATPAEAHLSRSLKKELTNELSNDRIKARSIRDKKEEVR